jgi:DNA adenine methylase
LADRILNFDLTEDNVKRVLEADDPNKPRSFRERAFATIVRNRVQRGGILAPGAGLVKVGENGRGLKSRWYPTTLAKRICEIDEIRNRLSFFPDDGFMLLQDFLDEPRAAVFLDPPYTTAAKRLYSHWKVDHRRLFGLAAELKGDFLITYDDTNEVVALANEYGFAIKRILMKNTHHEKKNELLIGRRLDWVPD